MNYPLLFFKENDNNIYATNKMFSIVSIGGEKFYKKLTVIDKFGNISRIIKVKIKGRAKLKYCILYFQKMIELELIFSDKKSKIDLLGLKKLLINKIQENPKRWLTLGLEEDLIKEINKKPNFKELILMFR